MKHLLQLILGLFVSLPAQAISLGRRMVHDAAFVYRMNAGFPGNVTRTHPVEIEPDILSVTTGPFLSFGIGALVDAADPNRGMRPLNAGDQALTAIDAILVRPFPFQQPTTSNFSGAVALGTAGVPPTTGAADFLRSGYINVQLPTGQTPVMGGTVYIWTAANSGVHVQGGFEAVNPAGSGMALTGIGSGKTYFRGGVDANGVAEIAFNV
jgi:hypothetical protein